MDLIPPRGPRLNEDEMLLAFDVDCGYLIEGHRLIARGIKDDGVIDSFGWNGTGGEFVPVFSFEYELVPGVDAPGDPPFGYLVQINYTADVVLPWEPTDGGAIAPFSGGSTTHGSRGSWPLPRDARILRFEMSGIDPSTGWPRARPDGTLTVDLQDMSAVWTRSH
jgi:hypothetical protein